MSKHTVSRLLADHNKGVHQTSGTDGMLARLFRSFLRDHKLSFDMWERLIRAYIDEIAAESEMLCQETGNHNSYVEKEKLTSERTNLRNALADKSMTWPTFNKGMRFFRCSKFTVEVTGEINGKAVNKACVTILVREKDRREANGIYANLGLNELMLELLRVAGFPQENGLPQLEGPLWEEYLQKYIDKEIKANPALCKGESEMKTVISSLRTSLKKNLQRDGMTWRTFINGLKFLQFQSVTFKVTMYPDNKPALVQVLTILLDEDE